MVAITTNKQGKEEKMKALKPIALILIIVGGLNWGLVGVFKFDLVASIFGDMSALSRVVYTVVGVAAVYAVTLLGPHFKKNV
jgi:uncharacterized membrane protein YuzA (DUF378 family)